jgi:chromosome segregation ATPase
MRKLRAMNETIKFKDASPLVQAVLTLDDHFQNLVRLSEKIDENGLKTDGDIEQARKLMGKFAEVGEGISTGVATLSQALNEARAKAEVAANKVSEKANIIQGRQGEEAKLGDVFRALAEKVGALNQNLMKVKPASNDGEITDEERARTIEAFNDIDAQLKPLITEAETLRDDAQRLKMKGLEQQASSLAAHLINVKEKISSVVGPKN